MIARDAEEELAEGQRIRVTELQRGKSGRADVAMAVATTPHEGELTDEELRASLATEVPGSSCEVASLGQRPTARCRGFLIIDGTSRPCLAYEWIAGPHLASVRFVFPDAPTYDQEREAEAIIASLEPL